MNVSEPTESYHWCRNRHAPADRSNCSRNTERKLIADVVTGKLDVREAAAQLPDETHDQDPIEESGPLTDGIAEASTTPMRR